MRQTKKKQKKYYELYSKILVGKSSQGSAMTHPRSSVKQTIRLVYHELRHYKKYNNTFIIFLLINSSISPCSAGDAALDETSGGGADTSTGRGNTSISAAPKTWERLSPTSCVCAGSTGCGGAHTWIGAAPTPDGGAHTWKGAVPTPDGGAHTWKGAVPTPDGGAHTWKGAAPTPDGGAHAWKGAAPTPDGGAHTWNGLVNVG